MFRVLYKAHANDLTIRLDSPPPLALKHFQVALNLVRAEVPGAFTRIASLDHTLIAVVRVTGFGGEIYKRVELARALFQETLDLFGEYASDTRWITADATHCHNCGEKLLFPRELKSHRCDRCQYIQQAMRP